MVGTGVLDQRIQRLAQSLTSEIELKEVNAVLDNWKHGKIDSISAYRSLESLKYGVVYGWGRDDFGEVINRDNYNYVRVLRPQEIKKFGTVTKVLASESTSFAQKGEKLYVCGLNNSGELGLACPREKSYYSRYFRPCTSYRDVRLV